jgi:hypothetical protein
MALPKFLILRCLVQRGLEGRRALIQPLRRNDKNSIKGRVSRYSGSRAGDAAARYQLPCSTGGLRCERKIAAARHDEAVQDGLLGDRQ